MAGSINQVILVGNLGRDPEVRFSQNGTKIVDNVMIEGITGGALDSHESQPGPILLQGDHTQITYRNIVLTPLIRP